MTNSKKLNNSSEIGIKHRYIDADKLSASITSAIELSEKIGSDTHSKQRMQYAIALQKVNKIIKEYPAADVQPIVHAHLVPIRPEHEDHRTIGIGLVYCDNCGNTFAPAHERIKSIKYCPYCGAKIDGDEHDTD